MEGKQSKLGVRWSFGAMGSRLETNPPKRSRGEQMSELSRRSFLSAGAGALGGAALASALPPSLQQALAMPVASGGM